MKTIDLCCGAIGGMRRGFELDGDLADILLCAEKDEYACRTVPASLR